MRGWQLVSPLGSLQSGHPDDPNAGFHAGHVNDALRLNLPPINPLLAASDTSGVWQLSELGGPAIALSWDWDLPHLNCLAHGIYGEEHVYAAGDALWETDVTQIAPLFAWRKIDIVDSNHNTLSVGEIYRVVVVSQRQTIVLATDTGIWWSRIPNPPGGPYNFQQATLSLGLPLPGQRYSGLAEGLNTTIVAGCWGTDLANGFGIFVGEWSGPGGSLVFTTRAGIHGLDPRKMCRTEITAFPGDRHYLYAVCGGAGVTPLLDPAGNVQPDGLGALKWSGDDYLLGVLRSDDGGLTWQATGSHVDGADLPLFPAAPGADLVGHTQFGYNLCVGVSPFHRDLVAVGVVHFLVSTDGGNRWRHFNPDGHPHLHEDTHACYFDPLDPHQLHICSDGGVATTPDLGGSWSTLTNRQLPNLQLRRFAVSGHDDGLIASSAQDNGDIATPQYPNLDFWSLLPDDGGDGVLSMFAGTGHLVYHNNVEQAAGPGGAPIDFGSKARLAAWDSSARHFNTIQMFPDYPLSLGVIPVDGTSDGLANDGRLNYENVVDVPFETAWFSPAGETLQAFGAEGETLYGLFAKADSTFHWQQLGTVPHQPDLDSKGAEKPYFATAVGSNDGQSVVVGMNNGKLFQLSAPGWSPANLSDPSITLPITRIEMLDAGEIFLIAGANVFHRSGGAWTLLPSGSAAGLLPAGDPFVALAADRSAAPARLFVATGHGVWQSDDNGLTWFPDAIGLPKMPNCWDLRTVTESSGAAFVYLSTFGWSAFRKLTNLPDTKLTFAATGHMDIVDRVAVGSDIWGHPTFTRIGQLGPLHPKEEYLIQGDNGDEVRVDLRLRCAWKVGDSVEVHFDATLYDEDGDVADQQSDLRIVTLGATETAVLDLASDELWPDRAHIELTLHTF